MRGALGFLSKAPSALKEARYQAERAKHMIKHIEALEMKKHNGLSAAAQEREARASEAYLKALEADALAAASLSELLARIDSAKLTIDVWRTESASERAAANFG